MKQETLDALARAIAKEEGFFDPIGPKGPNRPQRNHNPGDLRCEWFPYPNDPGGFVVFPNDETGWAALRQDITNHAKKYPDQSLYGFIAGEGEWTGYAPASDGNNPVEYSRKVAAAIGCSPFTRFQELA